MKPKIEIDSEKTETDFKKAWKRILEDITTDPKFKDIKCSISWLEEVLMKNVPFGKHMRAHVCMEMYQHLEPDRTEDEDLLNYITGWILEILQTAMVIAVDIMDDANVRNGKLAWNKVSHVGIYAVNDVFLLEHFAYFLVFKYFLEKDYVDEFITHLFTNTLKKILSETIDVRYVKDPDEEIDSLNRFTEEKFKTLVKYKTAQFTFYGPITTALIRTGNKDKSIFKAIEDLSQSFGELYQMETDFTRTFGGKHQFGNFDEHVRFGKMNWLITQAVKLSNVAQKQVLREHYGKADSESIAEVKRIYGEIGLKKHFKEEVNKLKKSIVQMINDMPSQIPKTPLLNILNSLNINYD